MCSLLQYVSCKADVETVEVNITWGQICMETGGEVAIREGGQLVVTD